MEILLGIVLLLTLVLIMIFPVMCFYKLRSISSKLSDIEHRINLLDIKDNSPDKTAEPPVEKTCTASPEAEKEQSTTPEQQLPPVALPKTEQESMTKTYAPAKARSNSGFSSPAWEEKYAEVNAGLSEFEARSAAVFKQIWSWICVGEEFRSKNVTKEYAVATTWLIRLGVMILLCGIGFFLKYSIDRNWTPPVVRVSLMFIAGLAMAMIGSWKSQGKYRPLLLASAGAGFVTLYLSIMAAYKLYNLVSPLYAFMFMIVVTTGAIACALGTNGLLIALLGCIGGYLTPVFISTGSQNLTALFIYMTILGCGTLLAARYRNWILLNLSSFIFYAVIAGIAIGKYLNAENALIVIGFIALNFAIFSIQNYSASLKRDMTFAEILLFCFNLIFYLSAVLPGAYKYFKEWEMPAIITIFASLLAAGKLFYLIRKNQISQVKVLSIFLQIELVFSLALTIPLLLGEVWIIATWSILAYLLIDASCRIKSRTLLIFAVIIYIACAWYETYNPRIFSTEDNSFLKQFMHVLLTAGIYTASLAASAVKLLKSTSIPADRSTSENRVIGGLAQIFIVIACLIFFYCSSYELHFAMHCCFIEFKAGILVAYWSILAAVAAFIMNKYGICKLYFIPLALLVLSGGWMLISGERFSDEGFWKSFAFTLATAGVYTVSTLLAAREFAKQAKKATCEAKNRKIFSGIALFLYSFSGILFFIYSSKEFYEFLVCYLKSFRNGGLSVYWSTLAFTLLVWGLIRQHKVLRMCSIGLFITVALKIFFTDLADLEQLWRIVAFAAIGVVMLIGAVVYIRCKDMFINEESKKQ